MMASERLRWFIRMFQSKSGRMIIMLILTVAIAAAEIVYGIRTRSQLLIADGLFSFAEGIALVGSLLALRYAKITRLHAKNTFGWARLELLAGLLQEVLLLSLSLSIIIEAINKLINPHHIEDPLVMIYLGSAGVCIGLLGLVLFRGYHHDHNIGNEIVEQKKNDFVQSVCNTIRDLDKNHLNQNESLINETSFDINEPKKKRHDLILPSLNDSYTNAFIVADRIEKVYQQQLSVPDNTAIRLNRSRRNSGESMISSTSILNEDKTGLDDEFQESRVYATLHALCLHSLAVLLESSIVLLTGLLNKFIPSKDHETGKIINTWLKYVDPSLTLVMVVIIAVKAIPVIWALGHILVEAVPAGINTDQLIQTIMKTIPQIRAVHGVHVWRATAQDVYATLHVVCDEDLPLSICTDSFGRQLYKIFETHCIRHFTIQYEYTKPGENMYRCAYGTRRRHRGHQSSSDDNGNKIQSKIDLHVNPFQTDHIVKNSIEEYV